MKRCARRARARTIKQFVRRVLGGPQSAMMRRFDALSFVRAVPAS